MSAHLLLLAPSANRVYAGEASRLARAELAICCPFATTPRISEVAGLTYLEFDAEPTPDQVGVIAGLSASFALFRRQGDALVPVALPHPDSFDDDLVTIPKYQGKTNEQFTRLLVNVTLAARDSGRIAPLDILDPLAGRGTTLETAWTMGHNAFGVEEDARAFEAMTAYLRTYLRRKRYKHQASVTPVRREGKVLGRRFDATVHVGPTELAMTVFTGDTRHSAALYGKRRFDAVVTDAPYGVVHGARTDPRHRDRSPSSLLQQAVPVWASQLRPGGALGLSWNTLGLTRPDLVAILGDAGLEVHDEGQWLEFGHRVDSSIHRDLVVATRPAENPPLAQ